MTKNMEEGYYGSATSLKSSSGHLQERKEWRASRGNKNQRKQQPNLFVIEKLINSQSEKEMEIFIQVNLRIITWETVLRKLWELFWWGKWGSYYAVILAKEACEFKHTSQQMVAVNGFGAFVIMERARNWVHKIFSWKFQSYLKASSASFPRAQSAAYWPSPSIPFRVYLSHISACSS